MRAPSPVCNAGIAGAMLYLDGEGHVRTREKGRRGKEEGGRGDGAVEQFASTV